MKCPVLTLEFPVHTSEMHKAEICRPRPALPLSGWWQARHKSRREGPHLEGGATKTREGEAYDCPRAP